MQANTRDNSMEVHYVSITFLLAFEWSGKALKRQGVNGFGLCRNGITGCGGWSGDRCGRHGDSVEEVGGVARLGV